MIRGSSFRDVIKSNFFKFSESFPEKTVRYDMISVQILTSYCIKVCVSFSPKIKSYVRSMSYDPPPTITCSNLSKAILEQGVKCV